MRILLAAIGLAQTVAIAPAASFEYGLLFWTNRFKGGGDYSDRASAFATDYRGNIVVTGSSWTGHSSDYLTIAFSSDGVPLWTNRYSGPQSYYGEALAIDPLGRVFVTGIAEDGSYPRSIATIAYSPTGVALWTNIFGHAETFAAGANGITVSDKGMVFIAGTSYTTNSIGRLYDLSLVAYARDGSALWTNFYNGPGNSSDDANAVAVDTIGNVFVCGSSYLGTAGSPFDCVTLGYAENGTPLWTNIYSGVALDDYDYISMFMAVGSNAVYVAGGTTPGVRNGDFLTLAYSKTGIPLWTNFYNDVRGRRDRATAIAVDNSDNVYITGRSLTDFGRNDRDYATVAYSASGISLWTNVYNGLANGEDEATGIAVDARGNVFVTGRSRGSGSTFDFITIVYSNSGAPLHTNRYDSDGDDRPLIKSPIRAIQDGFVVAGTSIVKYLTGGPFINSSRVGAEVSLSWPSVWGNFALQESFDSGMSSWSNVPQPPTDDGRRKRVSVPVEPGSRVFRLRQ